MSSQAHNLLPIYELKPPLLEAMREGNRAIVQAPTGSGKSTQVPQMLLDAGLAGAGQIVVLQPRRLAARMLAARVAWERGVPLGAEVGYQVRFERQCGAETRIRYVTDGVLLRQLVDDPRLSQAAILIFDEFHERRLYTDVMLGRAVQLQHGARPDLKIVVMSATLDSPTLGFYLAPCPVLESEGRVYPVSISYLEKAVDTDRTPVWDVAAREFERGVRNEREGDVLVFMPGAYEIRRTIEAIARTRAGKAFTVLPLHGDLPPGEQDAAVAPSARRKVVVATNVAETSLTIDGVRLVIDSGLARKARFDPYRGINTLLIEKISRASADQRAGRAGRTAQGACLRLWTEREHRDRPAQELPEVQRVDLAETVLLLKACGQADVARFPWIDPPPEKALAHALGLLTDLGGLHASTGSLTGLGRRMLSFPAHPRYARMLIAAEHFGCVPTAALIAALTQERNLLLRRQGLDVREQRESVLGEESESDLLLLMRAWRHAAAHRFDVAACRQVGIHAQTARQVGRIVDQFLQIAEQQGLDMFEQNPPSSSVRRCILSGFSDQLARRLSSGSTRYEVVHRRRGNLDKESVVRDSALIVAAEVQEIGSSRGDVDVRLALVTAIDQAWLAEMFPEETREQRHVAFDPATRRVRAEQQWWFRDLLLDSRQAGEPTADEAAVALAQEVHAGRLTLKQWNHGVEQWILRLNSLAGWCPELGLPPIRDEDRLALLEQVCHGATGYKDIKDKPVQPVVKAWLAPAQQALLEKHAPERVKLSNGRTPKVTYETGRPPHLSLRIQELYDVTAPVTIAMGRVRVVVEILAPNHRPVQVTDDLASFWTTHYPKVKKELQRRYPKHEWR